MKLLLTVGGVYNIAFAIFHIFFWKIFNWNRDLKKLEKINKAIMQVLNLCLTFCFIVFSYLSFFHSAELLTTSLGTVVLSAISIFWLLRAIEQMVFFKRKNLVSIVFFIVFLGGFVIYGIPLFA